MNTCAGTEGICRLVDLIRDVQGRGVSLWLSNGELRYRAPKGALTPSEIQFLRENKAKIVSFLEKAASARFAEPQAKPQLALNRAPLAFSQQAYWNLFGLE